MMSTLSVTVDQAYHAAMLAEWLKNIRFVKEVEVRVDTLPKKGNAVEIQKRLDAMKSKHLFADIADPIAYQRQLRNEWER